MQKDNLIFTIGHSNLSFENFYNLLKYWKIDAVVDVRSHPITKYTPHFNGGNKQLKNLLKKYKINYLHFKEEFGARVKDPSMYNKNGQVDFEKMQKRPIFKQGIIRIKQGLKNKKVIALMCACENPLKCHRFTMIADYLQRKESIDVYHIVAYKKNDKDKFHPLIFKKHISIKQDNYLVEYSLESHLKLRDFEEKQQWNDPKSSFGNLFSENNEKEFLKAKNKQIGYKSKKV